MATNRFIALIGDGRERFSDKELDEEKPTEPVVIDKYGVSDAYKYDGYVFLNEDWFTKYSKKWQEDPTEIDDLLVSLVKNAHKGCKSENLLKIQAYLSEPPESLDEVAEIWRKFYDPELKTI
ncbi:hypothetical protein DYBT9275_00091 [Dyadobacter sp. CECT 9275]|uniref:Uncharacterized protein n=1 Tax=Dyadobacter helix TaxID=2822344 RepID=A0A916N244_9BACT|nr:hypothetical protein [Dyadobacter sp. CECT 9275]CAG4988487.1 hypothetical protein DYBT9275_00091 [Dyadobacter sp. CECT 9275]